MQGPCTWQASLLGLASWVSLHPGCHCILGVTASWVSLHPGYHCILITRSTPHSGASASPGLTCAHTCQSHRRCRSPADAQGTPGCTVTSLWLLAGKGVPFHSCAPWHAPTREATRQYAGQEA